MVTFSWCINGRFKDINIRINKLLNSSTLGVKGTSPYDAHVLLGICSTTNGETKARTGLQSKLVQN